jgi:hypothetical protein
MSGTLFQRFTADPGHGHGNILDVLDAPTRRHGNLAQAAIAFFGLGFGFLRDRGNTTQTCCRQGARFDDAAVSAAGRYRTTHINPLHSSFETLSNLVIGKGYAVPIALITGHLSSRRSNYPKGQVQDAVGESGPMSG